MHIRVVRPLSGENAPSGGIHEVKGVRRNGVSVNNRLSGE